MRGCQETLKGNSPREQKKVKRGNGRDGSKTVSMSWPLLPTINQSFF